MKRLKDILLKILFKDNVVNWDGIFKVTVIVLGLVVLIYLVHCISVIMSL